MQSSQFSIACLIGKRNQGDSLADALISNYFVDATGKTELYSWLGSLKFNRDLGIDNNDLKKDLINASTRLPNWADLKRMRAGAVFYALHAEAIMNLLGLLSLPYCYTAANGAMVLYLSGRMHNDVEKRLHETAGFIWQVMAPNAFSPDGNGFVEILKVRLMHAAVRYYTKSNGNWKDQDYGVPVNQEDMAGTNLSFSLLIVRGLRKLGYTLKTEDKEDFLHLWAVIGYLSGINEDILAQDLKQALVIEATIKKGQFKASAHGRALTKTLIHQIKKIGGDRVSKAEVSGLMRYLLGNDVSDILGIDKSQLSPNKIDLLQWRNSLIDLFPKGEASIAYNMAYRSYKKQLLGNLMNINV